MCLIEPRVIFQTAQKLVESTHSAKNVSIFITSFGRYRRFHISQIVFVANKEDSG